MKGKHISETAHQMGLSLFLHPRLRHLQLHLTCAHTHKRNLDTDNIKYYCVLTLTNIRFMSYTCLCCNMFRFEYINNTQAQAHRSSNSQITVEQSQMFYSIRGFPHLWLLFFSFCLASLFAGCPLCIVRLEKSSISVILILFVFISFKSPCQTLSQRCD